MLSSTQLETDSHPKVLASVLPSPTLTTTFLLEDLIFSLFPGVPTDAPKNISWRFQTPDVVEIVYDPPPEHARNGQVK